VLSNGTLRVPDHGRASPRKRRRWPSRRGTRW